MYCSIGDWPGLVKQSFKLRKIPLILILGKHPLSNLAGIHCSFTKPGGWVEFQDFDTNGYSDDGSLTEDHEFRKWTRQLSDTFRNLGREPSPGPNLKTWVEDAGFVNITHRRLKTPIGLWPRDPRLVRLGLFYPTLIQVVGISLSGLLIVSTYASVEGNRCLLSYIVSEGIIY
jgi:hypothetical protein